MNRSFAILLILLLLSGSSLAAQISGVVKSSSGVPLEDVKILCGRSLIDGFVITKSDGAFAFPALCRLIIFQREGYRPLVKNISSSDHNLMVVLEEAGDSTWNVPTCSPFTDKRSVGFNLKLQAPEGVKVDAGYDTDYGYFSIRDERKEKRARIDGIGAGPYATFGVPREQDLLQARSFTVRAFKAGRFEGLDFQGQAADGTYWRFTGVMLVEAITYSGVTAETAASFDRLINKACISRR